MAQAKKVQKFDGGGVFRMNGRELPGQIALDELASAYAIAPVEERAMWSIAQRGIQDGNIVQYNSADNTIQVFDKDNNNITGNYSDSDASPNDSRLKRRTDATFDNDRHRFKKSGRYMALVNMRANPESEPEKPSKIKLRRGEGWWTYDKDKKYIDDFSGRDKHSILAGIRKYFDDENRDTLKDRYDLSGWNEDYMNTFLADYDKLENKDEFWNNLDSAIRNNSLDAYQKSLLQSWGFNDGTAASGGGSGNNTDKIIIDPRWEGNRDAATREGFGIRYGEDGRPEIYGNDKYTSGTWDLRGYNWAANSGYDVLSNGKFYTQQEVFDPNKTYNIDYDALGRYVHSFDEGSVNDRYDRAKNSGVHFYEGDYGNPFAEAIDPTKVYNHDLTKYFRENGLTGNYSLINASSAYNDLNGNTIYAYIDESQKRRENSLDFYDINYLIRDANGTVTPISKEDLEDQYSRNNSRFGGAKTPINGHEYTNIKGKDYAVYRDLVTGNGEHNTIYVGKDGYLYLGRKNDKGDDMQPKRIYDIKGLEELLKMNASDLSKVIDINARLSKFTHNPDIWSDTAIFRPRQTIVNNRQFRAGLPQYQFGGTLRNANSVAVNKSIDDAVTDYTGAHAIDGSQGGLTDAEKTKIAAAVGDLAGVGLTFIPGYGNILGAATGVVSSVANFSADKEMGKTGAGKNLAINLALDAASILPILGTGAKAAKAANTIRNLGSTAIRLLSLAGASAPAITAAQRIINGEKYTSRDLAEAISGIGSAAIAVKSHKDWIGDSKLAKEADAAKFAESNAHLNSVKKTKIVGKDGKSFIDESTPENIADFVKANPTQTEAVKAMQATAAENQVELSEKQAEEALKKLGINFDKGKINWKPWGNKKNGTTWLSRQNGTVSYTTPKEQQAGNLFSYLMLGRRRAKAFSPNGGLSTYTPEQINVAVARVESGQGTLLDQALLRATAYNPQSFGDIFKTQSGYSPVINGKRWTFGGHRFRKPKTPNPVTSNPNRVIDMDAYWDSAFPSIPVGRFTSPYMVDMPLSTARTYYNGVDALNYLAFKKGGKIPKGQNNLRTPKLYPDYWKGTWDVNDYGLLWPMTETTQTIEATSNQNQDNTNVSTQSQTSKKTIKTTPNASGQGAAQVETPSIEETITPRFSALDTRTFTRTAGNFKVQNSMNTQDSKLGNAFTVNGPNFIGGLLRDTSTGRLLTREDGSLIGSNVKEPSFSVTYHLGTERNPNDKTVPLGINIEGNLDNSGAGNGTGDGAGNGAGDENEKSKGGPWGDGLKINWANLADDASMLFGTSLHKQQLRNGLRGNDALLANQHQAAQYTLPTYNYSDIDQGYTGVLGTINSAKNVSSDGFANISFNLGKAASASDALREWTLKRSLRKSEIDNARDQINNANVNSRISTANRNLDYTTNVLNAREQLKSKAIADWYTNIFGPWNYQKRQDLRDWVNARNEIKNQSDLNLENKIAEQNFNNTIDPLKTRFQKTDEYKNGMSFEEWVALNPERKRTYENAYKTRQGALELNATNFKNKNIYDYSPFIFAKSGGKTRNHRDTMEQMALNVQKLSAQSAKKLSDTLEKMILRLMNK